MVLKWTAAPGPQSLEGDLGLWPARGALENRASAATAEAYFIFLSLVRRQLFGG